MSLRQMINGNPAVGAVIAVVLIAIAVGAIWYNMQPTTYGPPTKAFYTVDDGKNLFVDEVNKQTPFDYEGKQAVKAYVYTCDNGKTRFVAYLERLPEGAKVPAASAVDAPEEAPAPKNEAEARAMSTRRAAPGQFTALVRKPGDKDWVKPGDPKYFNIIAVRCTGSDQVLDKVNP